MRQEILAGALKPIHKQAGLCLEELDDHILILKYKEKRIAFFNQTTVKIEEIHKAADTYLKETDFFAVDPAVRHVRAERPFYDKTVTMNDFLDYLCGRKANA